MNALGVFANYQEIVRRVRSVFPDAVLAGGAVRDTLLCRPVKDLDFVLTEREVEVSDYNLNKAFPGEHFRSLRTQATLYGEAEDGSGLLYVKSNQGDTINLLVVDSVERKLQSFPDSISRVWFDGEYIRESELFREAVRTKVIRIGEPQRASRIARLRAKYPDYVFEEVDLV